MSVEEQTRCNADSGNQHLQAGAGCSEPTRSRREEIATKVFLVFGLVAALAIFSLFVFGCIRSIRHRLAARKAPSKPEADPIATQNSDSVRKYRQKVYEFLRRPKLEPASEFTLSQLENCVHRP